MYVSGIWIAYGTQTLGRVSVLNAAESLMYDLDVKVRNFTGTLGVS